MAGAAAPPRWAGQPPTAMRSASWAMVTGATCPRWGSPSSRPRREMAPVEWPLSKSDIGRIRSRVKRPAPVWRVTSSAGTAEPVRMNCPRPERSSTARRTWFQTSGANCHLSSSRGGSPGQDDGRIDAHHPLSVEVDVEQHMAGAGLHRRRRLADRPSAFHKDGPGRGQQLGELGVGDARAVVGAFCGPCPRVARPGVAKQRPRGAVRRSFRGCFRGIVTVD